MIIEIFGLDPYVVARLSQALHQPLVQLTKVAEEDVFFSAHEAILYHQGVDQNAWHTWIKIYLDPQFANKQEAIVHLLHKHLLDQTVHIHVQFIYVSTSQKIHLIQKDYPLFVTEKNTVEIQEPELPQQDIYHGNAFAGKEEALDQLVSSNAKRKKKTTN